ncbi:MAG: diacylglycerol/polyprenol kinase family protein [Bdellovibrionota bacterium]
MSVPEQTGFLQKLRALRLGGSATGLRRRSDLHLKRKFFHMQGAVSFLVPYLFFDFSRETMAAILGTVLALVMTVEYSRARWEWVNSIAVKAMGGVMRDTEVNQLTGIPFYMASCLFAFLIFPRHVTVLAILYLAFGDPSSSFFGVLYGRNKIFPNKSLQGTLGGFVVCAVATFAYLHWQAFPPGKVLLLSLIGGFAGALSELLPLNIDDNFAIPVVSGALMALALWSAQLPLSP